MSTKTYHITTRDGVVCSIAASSLTDLSHTLLAFHDLPLVPGLDLSEGNIAQILIDTDTNLEGCD